MADIYERIKVYTLGAVGGAFSIDDLKPLLAGAAAIVLDFLYTWLKRKLKNIKVKK